jgi:hypothetical protein
MGGVSFARSCVALQDVRTGRPRLDGRNVARSAPYRIEEPGWSGPAARRVSHDSPVRSPAQEEPMAKMCPLSGCKSHPSFCIHDKMMIGMGVMAMLAAVAHWGLHLF